ncbi:MAG: hypothetical protein ACK4GL_04200 [Flavobacteriales bacterium]
MQVRYRAALHPENGITFLAVVPFSFITLLHGRAYFSPDYFCCLR